VRIFSEDQAGGNLGDPLGVKGICSGVFDRSEYILNAIYDSTNGSNWKADSNNWGSLGTTPVCDLTGVSCSADGEITGLQLGK
jgi:hypothetical protein